MEHMNCFMCNQDPVNCGGRSHRRAESFEIKMMHGFEDGVAIPCKLGECFNQICQKNWMVVKNPAYTYDMYLEKETTRTLTCGPFWSVFVRVTKLNVGDIVSFTFDKNEDCFHFVCYDVVDDMKQAKQYEGFMEIGDGDFYVPAKEMKFLIHKYDVNNVEPDGLWVSRKILEGIKRLASGPTCMFSKYIEDRFKSSYLYQVNDDTGFISFSLGWHLFAQLNHLVEGSVLVARVEARGDDKIILDFVEILNP